MSEEIQRLQAQIATQMKHLGAAVNDPRLAPMLAQLQALLRQHMASAGANGRLAVLPNGAPGETGDDGPTKKLLSNLPPPIQDSAREYIRSARAHAIHMFTQAPALSDSDAGRRLLELGMAERAHLAVHAYVAWASERYGGRDGAALRRIVSDILRAKIDIDSDQAVALVKAAIHEGFAYASYSPNQAVANVVKRHVETRGASPALQDVLVGLRTRMVHSSADSSSEGRKLISIVDALIAHQARPNGSAPHFEAKPDIWGKAVGAKLAALPPDMRSHAIRLLELAANGGGNAKPAKGWLKTVEAALKGSRTRAHRHAAAGDHRVLRAWRYACAGEPEHAARAGLARGVGGARDRRPPPRSLCAKMPDVLAAAFRLSVARARQRRDPRLQPDARNFGRR